MAYKQYFIKASWQDAAQPLRRVHANTKMELDLTKEVWVIQKDVSEYLVGRYDNVVDFIIDFMIECEG